MTSARKDKVLLLTLDSDDATVIAKSSADGGNQEWELKWKIESKINLSLFCMSSNKFIANLRFDCLSFRLMLCTISSWLPSIYIFFDAFCYNKQKCLIILFSEKVGRVRAYFILCIYQIWLDKVHFFFRTFFARSSIWWYSQTW